MKISPALIVFPLIVAAATEPVTAKSPIEKFDAGKGDPVFEDLLQPAARRRALKPGEGKAASEAAPQNQVSVVLEGRHVPDYEAVPSDDVEDSARHLSEACVDSETWFSEMWFNGTKKPRNCAWVAKAPRKRCHPWLKSESGLKAKNACRVACSTCGAHPPRHVGNIHRNTLFNQFGLEEYAFAHQHRLPTSWHLVSSPFRNASRCLTLKKSKCAGFCVRKNDECVTHDEADREGETNVCDAVECCQDCWAEMKMTQAVADAHWEDLERDCQELQVTQHPVMFINFVLAKERTRLAMHPLWKKTCLQKTLRIFSYEPPIYHMPVADSLMFKRNAFLTVPYTTVNKVNRVSLSLRPWRYLGEFDGGRGDRPIRKALVEYLNGTEHHRSGSKVCGGKRDGESSAARPEAAASENVAFDDENERRRAAAEQSERRGACSDITSREVCKNAANKADCSWSKSREKCEEKCNEANADFCLEPPGDTPTRSHFYYAIAQGCLPVIFEPSDLRYPYMGSAQDLRSLSVDWAWREPLDIPSFAVVVTDPNVSAVFERLLTMSVDEIIQRKSRLENVQDLYVYKDTGPDALQAVIDESLERWPDLKYD